MKIAIAGYGQEGESSLKYWQALGAEITIFDEKQPAREIPDGVKTYFAPDAFSKMNGFDFVIRTAGLNPNKISSNSKIWSATNEFFKNCPAEIIGVTGTKGKGTTATLISKILEEAGYKTWLLGNIGVPALSLLDEIKSYESRVVSQEEPGAIHNSELIPHISAAKSGVVVYELSSFQLWDLEKSPQTAVVLMIEADHMDVHASMTEYVTAKANIAKYQKPEDLLVYHPNNKYSADIAASSPAQKRRYMTPEGAHIVPVISTEAEKSGLDLNLPDLSTNTQDDNSRQILIEENPICAVDEVGLLGAHNLENICAAITAAWNYTQDIAAIKNAVISFKGLPHRLEVVGSVNGVTYIDDSFSSASGATIAAIKSFTQPEILICGGFDRGLDYANLVQNITEQQNIKKVLLIGQTAQNISELLEEQGFTNFQIMKSDFSAIIQFAANLAESGDVVLLSPGCASFDMFKNFKDRGDQFKKLVGEL